MISFLSHYRDPLSRLEKKRKRFITHPQVPDWLKAIFSDPIPDGKTAITDREIIAIDFETSGLLPEQDKILSIGLLEIKHQTLLLASGQHWYISQSDCINANSAVINHIVPQLLHRGSSLEETIKTILQRCKNKIMLAHGAVIEQQFLQHCFPAGMPTLPLIWLDTLQLEKSLTVNRMSVRNDYRLSRIRQTKGLPDYPAHNALMDAVSTAELFLVLIKQISPQLNVLYKRSIDR